MAKFRLRLYYMKYNSWLCFAMDLLHHKFLIGQGYSLFFSSLELYTMYNDDAIRSSCYGRQMNWHSISNGSFDSVGLFLAPHVKFI